MHDFLTIILLAVEIVISSTLISLLLTIVEFNTIIGFYSHTPLTYFYKTAGPRLTLLGNMKNKRILARMKATTSLEQATPYLGLLTQPAVAGAVSLGDLQLIIYWH